MKVFVGLFGLNRSLKWTAQSINEKILLPIKDVVSDVYIGAHFNVPENINNPRSNENLIRYQNRGMESLDFDMLWLEKQSITNISKFIEQIDSVKLVEDSLQIESIIRNHLQQLYSLKRLWEMICLLGQDNSELFIFLRPDLEYLDTIDVEWILRSVLKNGTDLITPKWHQWKGLNDRIAICSRKGAEVYLKRLDCFQNFYQKMRTVHAESLLSFVAHRGELNLELMPLRGVRVRANGLTKIEEFQLTTRQLLKFKIRNGKAKFIPLLVRS